MNTAVVTYSNGDVITTSINCTIPQALRYFAIGRWFNIGSVTDNMQQVENVTVYKSLT